MFAKKFSFLLTVATCLCLNAIQLRANDEKEKEDAKKYTQQVLNALKKHEKIIAETGMFPAGDKEMESIFSFCFLSGTPTRYLLTDFLITIAEFLTVAVMKGDELKKDWNTLYGENIFKNRIQVEHGLYAYEITDINYKVGSITGEIKVSFDCNHKFEISYKTNNGMVTNYSIRLWLIHPEKIGFPVINCQMYLKANEKGESEITSITMTTGETTYYSDKVKYIIQTRMTPIGMWIVPPPYVGYKGTFYFLKDDKGKYTKTSWFGYYTASFNFIKRLLQLFFPPK